MNFVQILPDKAFPSQVAAFFDVSEESSGDLWEYKKTNQKLEKFQINFQAEI